MMMVLTTAALLSSCASTGGFNEMLGISNEGIDANQVELNDPLKKANSNALPVPQGADNSIKVAQKTPNLFDFSALFGLAPKAEEPKVEDAAVTTGPIKIIPPKIIAPQITAPKVTKAVVVTKPVPKPKVKAKVTPKPEVKVAAVTGKIKPADYKFVDLFTFRSDMRAGKLADPLATAALVAKTNPSVCKLEGIKFTCGEYFINVE